MSYPKNELAQLVIAYCAAYKIEDIVISPGSRNAPLTIGFTNHPTFKAYSIADERCAAFFALGIAQQKRKPVAVVCTSGSALLNYYPAFAEAFYSDIPLVVISADRPKHLIDIGDGQTIRQENVLEKHSLSNANLIADVNESKQNASLLQDALRTAIQQNGPVHINVPFNEPLYETVNELSFEIFPEKDVNKDALLNKLQEYATIWNASQRKIIMAGVNYPDDKLQRLINYFADDPSVIVLTETTSNLHNPNFINAIDKLIMPLEEGQFVALQPEILLTFGGMIVSKKIKQLLRKYRPKHHWHVDEKRAFNTYFSLNRHFEVSPVDFFRQFNTLCKKMPSSYQQQWLGLKDVRTEKHKVYLQTIKFSDFKVFDAVLKSIPDECQLQLGNSSVVRYAQLFDLNTTLNVFCNRGTSGIDGSTSTAIGASLPVKEPTVFITGDISFFYDSNALWNNHIRKDFRIVLINNSGGGIFRIIPGPLESNALNYFEATHRLNAKNLCDMFGFEYDCVNAMPGLKDKLTDFYKPSEQPRLLEVQTPRNENDRVLKEYFKSLR